jgi:hypothetical protein
MEMTPCNVVFTSFRTRYRGEVPGVKTDADTERGKVAVEKNTESGGSDPTLCGFQPPTISWGRSRHPAQATVPGVFSAVAKSFQHYYNTMPFTTPFMVSSALFSGLHIFMFKVRCRISPGHFRPYRGPRERNGHYLTGGEVHNPRKAGPSETPRWPPFPNADYSPELQFSVQLELARRAAAYVRSAKHR